MKPTESDQVSSLRKAPEVNVRQGLFGGIVSCEHRGKCWEPLRVAATPVVQNAGGVRVRLHVYPVYNQHVLVVFFKERLIVGIGCIYEVSDILGFFSFGPVSDFLFAWLISFGVAKACNVPPAIALQGNE